MKRVARAVVWIVLAALCLLYLIKPDGAAALTIFPSWTWLPIGLAATAFRWRIDRRFPSLLLAAWTLGLLAFSEEWRSLPRWGVEERAPETIRVVSLNCAGGTIAAAEEVAAFRPDVVLLQESPGSDELARLARQLFGVEGQVVTGPDATILARGPIRAFAVPRGTANFVAASVELRGQSVTVVSLRLAPPEFRVDLFNPEAWPAVAANRRARRREIAEIANYLLRTAKGPTILGGDFNCQSGDRAQDAMPPDLRDTFYEGGRGWCHTAVNDFPLARIDQVWVSPEVRVEQQFVRKTVSSDHRMVVCDLALE